MTLSNLELELIQMVIQYISNEDKEEPILLNEEGVKKLAEISLKITKNTFKSDVDIDAIKTSVTNKFLKNINYSKL